MEKLLDELQIMDPGKNNQATSNKHDYRELQYLLLYLR